MEITNITVIDEEIISEEPVSPRIVFNAALGVLGGLTAGLIFAFLIESMNNKIKNHEDVKRYLRLKTLGVIPHNSIDNKNNNKKSFNENSRICIPARDKKQQKNSLGCIKSKYLQIVRRFIY